MSRQHDWKSGRGSRGSGYRRGDKYRSEGRGGWKAGRGQSSNDGRSPYPHRPAGLRGREIGLWYRDRARNMRREGFVLPKAKPIYVPLNQKVADEIWASIEQFKVRPPEYLMKKYKIASQGSRNMEACKDEKEKFDDKSGTSSFIDSATDKYSHLEDSKFKTSFLNSITGTIEENLNRSLAVRSELRQKSDLDEMFIKELELKSSSKHYQEMMVFRKKLPSYSMKDEIINTIETNQVVVISGETGCGKTTQVPQFILDNEVRKGRGSTCHIVCTQPRRISAISVAERVADERDDKVESFGSVGYQIRLEKQLPRKRASILFCTTGILLQFMQSNPGLTFISHIVVDEIHERDVLSDFTITILKDVLAKRPDLKLILMSATLNADRFSQYYNGCPMLNIPGFTFPVTEFYLEDVLEMTRFPIKKETKARHSSRKSKKEDQAYAEFIEPYVRDMRSRRKYSYSTLDALLNPEIEEINLELIHALIYHICFVERGQGAILVFLPGWDKISSLFKLLNESGRFPGNRFRIIPLHSMMPTTSQKSIFDRPPPGVRKIVIATNIAETSITIDDIVYVIDSGKVKMKNFDVENNITTLRPEWISLANARQRRGRAGRVQAGVCYHMYTRAREMALADYPLPEMMRTRLEEVILQAKILQLGYVKHFLQKVLDPPETAAIDLSISMLVSLNALDDDESLTPLGYHLAQLPLDPQAGKMILMGAMFCCVDPIFSIAASLSFKDAFVIPLGREQQVDQVRQEFDMGRKSDHLVLAEVFSQWELAENQGWGHAFCQRKFLSRNILFLLKDMKGQFGDHLFDMKFLNSKDHKSRESNLNSNNVGLIRAIVASSLYPNVAVIKKAKTNRLGRTKVSLITAEDGKVEVHPKSVNGKVAGFESNFLVYHLKLKSLKIYLHDTTMVHPLPLLFFGHIKDKYNEGKQTIMELSSVIRFFMRPETARLVTELRIRLDWLLEKKISNPGVTNWDDDAEDGCILRAIKRLLSLEDQSLMYDNDEEPYDEEEIETEEDDDDDDNDEDGSEAHA